MPKKTVKKKVLPQVMIAETQLFDLRNLHHDIGVSVRSMFEKIEARLIKVEALQRAMPPKGQQ